MYMIYKRLFFSVISIINDLKLISFHISILTVSRQLNGFNYCYLTLIILSNTKQLFVHSKVIISIIFNTNYFIQRCSFICTKSNGFKHCSVIPITQFSHTRFQELRFNANNSIQYQSFIHKLKWFHVW